MSAAKFGARALAKNPHYSLKGSKAPKLKAVPEKSKGLHVEVSDADLYTLRTWAQSKRLDDNAAAAELLAFALAEHRSRTRGDTTRPQLMGESLAKTFAPKVHAFLGEKSAAAAEWIQVTYATAQLQGFKSHPGSRKGVVFLDNRAVSREEWADTAGVLSVESVLARLLGTARPLGVKA